MIAPLGFPLLFLVVTVLVVTGAVRAWTFWRYDFTTTFVALPFASVLWSTAGGGQQSADNRSA
ncbi:MAG: hypothetical protein BRD44_01520 [Bacteroidetes bacterium QS_7_67_15]|nr:MAG: hypothetical protein BRD44_01520 [Bacteroidetes bacterium QS_7_67_15]